MAEGNSVFALSYVIFERYLRMSNGMLFREGKFKCFCVCIATLGNHLENN